MTTDLDTDIRRALHTRADLVTPERLRHPEGPRPATLRGTRPRWAVVGPLVAAACVVLIAVALAVITRSAGTDRRPAGGSPDELTSLVGTSWSITAVREVGQAAVTVPASVNASITFERGGRFSAYDGVNYFRATYRLDDGRLLISGGVQSAVAYNGHDAATLAAIDGVGAVRSSRDVRVQRRGDTLELTTDRYVVTLSNEVPTATSSAPASSTTT